jgi:hypothetical protein
MNAEIIHINGRTIRNFKWFKSNESKIRVLTNTRLIPSKVLLDCFDVFDTLHDLLEFLYEVDGKLYRYYIEPDIECFEHPVYKLSNQYVYWYC